MDTISSIQRKSLLCRIRRMKAEKETYKAIAEYYRSLLNLPSTINEKNINDILGEFSLDWNNFGIYSLVPIVWKDVEN